MSSVELLCANRLGFPLTRKGRISVFKHASLLRRKLCKIHPSFCQVPNSDVIFIYRGQILLFLQSSLDQIPKSERVNMK